MCKTFKIIIFWHYPFKFPPTLISTLSPHSPAFMTWSTQIMQFVRLSRTNSLCLLLYHLFAFSLVEEHHLAEIPRRCRPDSCCRSFLHNSHTPSRPHFTGIMPQDYLCLSWCCSNNLTLNTLKDLSFINHKTVPLRRCNSYFFMFILCN